jgi:hypothetical protein
VSFIVLIIQQNKQFVKHFFTFFIRQNAQIGKLRFVHYLVHFSLDNWVADVV